MPLIPISSASLGTVRCHLGAPFIGPARKTVKPSLTTGTGDLMTLLEQTFFIDDEVIWITPVDTVRR